MIVPKVSTALWKGPVVFFFLFMSLAFPFLSFLVSRMHSDLLLTDHVKILI